MARTLITAPTTAKRGDVIELKTLIAHIMETGFRPDANGQTKPRDLINRFSCRYNNELVFSAELYPGRVGQPVHRLHHRGHRERHAQLQLGGRQRLRADRERGDHGHRMKPWLPVLLALLLAPPPPLRRRPTLAVPASTT